MHEVNAHAIMCINFMINKKDSQDFDEAFYEYRTVSLDIYKNVFDLRKFTVKGFYPVLYKTFQKEYNKYTKGDGA